MDIRQQIAMRTWCLANKIEITPTNYISLVARWEYVRSDPSCARFYAFADTVLQLEEAH
ncbi:hypothetical protein ABIB89_003181 [Bradyrhizobium sp. JR3.12]